MIILKIISYLDLNFPDSNLVSVCIGRYENDPVPLLRRVVRDSGSIVRISFNCDWRDTKDLGCGHVGLLSPNGSVDC